MQLAGISLVFFLVILLVGTNLGEDGISLPNSLFPVIFRIRKIWIMKWKA